VRPGHSSLRRWSVQCCGLSTAGVSVQAPQDRCDYRGDSQRVSETPGVSASAEDFALKRVTPILNFYMGKNMHEREDYIVDELIVPLEERASESSTPTYG
jgi:hypothetical protein